MSGNTYGQHTIENTHYDQFLTNISVSYREDHNFIGEQVVKVVEVDKKSDKYMVFDYRDHMIEDDDIRRAPGTVASEMRTGWSDDTYFADGYAKRYALYDEEIANADESRIFNLKTMAAKQVKAKLQLAKEINTAKLMTDANNFHADLKTNVGANGSGADVVQWSDYVNSDPMLDIIKLQEKGERLGGMFYNTLVLSAPVYQILRMHPKLKATVAGWSSPEFVSDDVIKQLLGVQNIIIARGRKATAAQRRVGEGGLTNYIWGNNAVLCYVPDAPGRDTPAAAYTFQWTNPMANVVGNQKTREYYSEEAKTRWIETEEWYGQKVVSKLGAVVLNDLVKPLVP